MILALNKGTITLGKHQRNAHPSSPVSFIFARMKKKRLVCCAICISGKIKYATRELCAIFPFSTKYCLKRACYKNAIYDLNRQATNDCGIKKQSFPRNRIIQPPWKLDPNLSRKVDTFTSGKIVLGIANIDTSRI